jgi:hypothetical protein
MSSSGPNPYNVPYGSASGNDGSGFHGVSTPVAPPVANPPAPQDQYQPAVPSSSGAVVRPTEAETPPAMQRGKGSQSMYSSADEFGRRRFTSSATFHDEPHPRFGYATAPSYSKQFDLARGIAHKSSATDTKEQGQSNAEGRNIQ